MTNKLKKLFANQYFLSFTAGSLSAGAFAPLYLFFLAIIAFSALFLLSNHYQNNLKQSFWIGWYFGFGQFVFGIYWITISLFVEIEKFFWLIPFALFAIPAFLAIYIGLAILLLNYLSKKLAISGYKKILLLAVIWVFFEFLRSILFTGFPWNLLGYSFLFSLSLSQLGAIIGVYGLSLLAIIFYCLPALFIKINQNKIKFISNNIDKKFAISAIIIAIIITIWGFYRLTNNNPKLLSNATFRLVQPNIKQEDRWRGDYRYQSFLENVKLSKKANFENINYVIWSESAVPYIIDKFKSYGLLSEIAFGTPKNGYVITGALRAEFDEERQNFNKIWNSIFVIDDNGKVIDYYDKNHLVPFGEYIPFENLLAKYLPFMKQITGDGSGFDAGQGVKTIKLNHQIPAFSPLVCYEIIFPNNVIDRQNPPKFLLNLTNDAWFGNSSGPYQHFAMAKMRSIEYGLPTIRVANSGISALIDPLGKTINKIDLNEKGIIDVQLMENLPITIYQKYGNWLVMFVSLLFLILIFGKIILKRQFGISNTKSHL